MRLWLEPCGQIVSNGRHEALVFRQLLFLVVGQGRIGVRDLCKAPHVAVQGVHPTPVLCVDGAFVKLSEPRKPLQIFPSRCYSSGAKPICDQELLLGVL